MEVCRYVPGLELASNVWILPISNKLSATKRFPPGRHNERNQIRFVMFAYQTCLLTKHDVLPFSQCVRLKIKVLKGHSVEF